MSIEGALDITVGLNIGSGGEDINGDVAPLR